MLAAVLAFAACNAPLPGMPPSPDNGGAVDAPLPADASNVVRPDAHAADARSADANPVPADAAGPDAGRTGGGDAGSSGGDAGSSGSDGGSAGSDAGGSGGGGGGNGVISCYTEGNPGATCTLPTHCCFSRYSSQHDGACATSACDYGTIECDGPEDCASGQHCCAHAIVDPQAGLIGYQLACQASACGAAPANQEMCHPTTASAAGTCSSPTSRCVTAFGNDNDLPPSLHICQ
ncbi:MAG TPA: hypothetical protein VF516_23495 [Kofleriaceae bacterium]